MAIPWASTNKPVDNGPTPSTGWWDSPSQVRQANFAAAVGGSR